MYEDKPPFRWQDRADRTVVLNYRKMLPDDRGDKISNVNRQRFFVLLRLLVVWIQSGSYGLL